MNRLVSLSTRNVPGLPDLALELLPVTALIGVSGSGKSRLLAALAWLIEGRPELSSRAPSKAAHVSAEVETARGRVTISRNDHAPTADLPTLVYLPVSARLPADATADLTDARAPHATLAEQMVTDIASEIASGTAGQLLVIDEPELMLTPQAQRHLYHLLRTFAEAGNQVIYATRAPALVDAVHHDEIVRLDISADRSAAHRAPAALLSDAERLRLAAEFDHERAEMFFATAVVLVEGNTERLSLPPIFRALGYDPDALGISIVEVGGKGNLVLAARVLAELRIPHLVVHDSDRGRPGAAENAGIRRAVGAAPVIELDPDFEAVARIHSHEDKVFHAWRRFHDAPPERIPEPFRRIVATAVRLAS